MIDPGESVDYSSGKVPKSYYCSICGANGCKLWRLYQTFLDHQELTCDKCAGNKDWKVAAVPTETNDTFWGLTSIPQEGITWWDNLPLEVKND